MPSGEAPSNDVFAALADPRRRQLFGTLVAGGPATATMLAADAGVTRQAVAKHLGILSDAGMATSSRVGRETRFEANVDSLSEVQRWIETVESQWTTRLGALAAALEARGG